MDGVDWNRAEIMQGQHYQSWGRPKLEIPSTEPATPRRRATNGQSPRGINEFPPSPQSPGEKMILSPMRGFVRVRSHSWVQESVDQITPPSLSSAQSSPSSNQSGTGFRDHGNEGGGNWVCRTPSMGYNFGEYVLVRCNQTKWLVGQVRRISSSGVKVWIGAAQTLVNVPVELFSTHLARVDCPTPPPSPTDTHNSSFNGEVSEVKARIQCVRPAHLSHRQLYQHVSQGSSVGFEPDVQMQLTKLSNLNSIDQHFPVTSRAPPTIPKHDKYDPEHFSKSLPKANLSDYVTTIFEQEKGQFPRLRSILKRSNSLSEHLNTVREEELMASSKFQQVENPDQQVQFSWRHHVVPNPQQGKRPSYHRPSALPMLNLNLNNESTPLSGTPTADGGHFNAELHRPTSSTALHEQDYKDFVRGSLASASIDKSPLQHPLYQTRDNLLHFSDKPGQDSWVTSMPKFTGKDKAVYSEDPPYHKVPDKIVYGGQNAGGMQLERSVSLDSSRSRTPTFSGPRNQWSLGSRPVKNASSPSEPVWVTVIENGQDIRRA